MSIDVKHVQDIPAYAGEHAIPGIRFRAARDAMGISAWGMNIIEFDPGTEGYPRHDHAHDGQEELYVVLDGSLVLEAGGAERVLNRGDMARVSADETRRFVTREVGATLLAIGGTPGAPYAPDPRMAG
jgi:uncharacterized cupin superfamily protein